MAGTLKTDPDAAGALVGFFEVRPCLGAAGTAAVAFATVDLVGVDELTLLAAGDAALPDPR